MFDLRACLIRRTRRGIWARTLALNATVYVKVMIYFKISSYSSADPIYTAICEFSSLASAIAFLGLKSTDLNISSEFSRKVLEKMNLVSQNRLFFSKMASWIASGICICSALTSWLFAYSKISMVFSWYSSEVINSDSLFSLDSSFFSRSLISPLNFCWSIN